MESDFENEKKKIKYYSDNEAEININQLPSEILWIIFNKCPRSSYKNLMLVCSRWKKMIEESHIFSVSRIFAKPRTEEEYELAVESNRKVELLIIVTCPSYNHQLNYIKKILSKDDNLIAKACLLLKNDTNQMFSMDLLCDYLKCVQNLEILYINFHRLFFNINNDMSPIYFNNLTFLGITDCSHQVVRKCLLSFKTPALTKFQINADYHQHAECDNIFKFLNRNSRKIEDVDIKMSFCNFKWTSESLELRPCRESREELVLFLKDRVSSLKKLSLVCTFEDPTLYSFIYKDAKNLESVYISFTFTIVVGLANLTSLKNVTELQLENFQYNEDNIAALSRMFPNIQSLCFRFSRSGKLTDNQKRLLRLMFQNLKRGMEFSEDFKICNF